MNSHLKGRIFQRKGINYLVLQNDDPSEEYVLVRALNSGRQVERMATALVSRYLEQARGTSVGGAL